MNGNENKQTKLYSFAGLGLVFGTAMGAVMTLILDIDIYWAGAGTAAGLIIGAAMDAQ